MSELIHTLKTEEFTRKSQTRMKRIRDAHLVIIDDMMYLAHTSAIASRLLNSNIRQNPYVHSKLKSKQEATAGSCIFAYREEFSGFPQYHV